MTRENSADEALTLERLREIVDAMKLAPKKPTIIGDDGREYYEFPAPPRR